MLTRLMVLSCSSIECQSVALYVGDGDHFESSSCRTGLGRAVNWQPPDCVRG